LQRARRRLRSRRRERAREDERDAAAFPAEDRPELGRELVRGDAVERDRRQARECAALLLLRVRLPLEDGDRAEPLAVDDEGAAVADEADVLARQADERVR